MRSFRVLTNLCRYKAIFRRVLGDVEATTIHKGMMNVTKFYLEKLRYDPYEKFKASKHRPSIIWMWYRRNPQNESCREFQIQHFELHHPHWILTWKYSQFWCNWHSRCGFIHLQSDKEEGYKKSRSSAAWLSQNSVIPFETEFHEML